MGTKKALAIGVRNDKTKKRYTYLKYRMNKNKIPAMLKEEISYSGKAATKKEIKSLSFDFFKEKL